MTVSTVKAQHTSVRAVAIQLDVSEVTIRRMIAAGDLAAVRIGRQWRIPITAVNRLLSPTTQQSDS